MPSPTSLVGLAQLAAFVALAYFISIGKMPTARGIAATILLITGGLGLYEGLLLAVREDARLRDGRVMTGVVVEMYRPDHKGHTYATSGRQGPLPGRSAFLSARAFAHWLAYGSPAILIVDYRYPCAAGRNGTCWGRDYVGPELWGRLRVGTPVNVRRGKGETKTARLDANPQLRLALAEIAIATVVLGAAGLLSGRVRLRRSREYLQAAAIVTAVEPVQYGDGTRWKVRFAYFDPQAAPRESVDEVCVPTWKPGDPCLAIYRPDLPDLATLQPVSHA